MQIKLEYNIQETDLKALVDNAFEYSGKHKRKRLFFIACTIGVYIIASHFLIPRMSIDDMILYSVLIGVLTYPMYKSAEKRKVSTNRKLWGRRLCIISETGLYLYDISEEIVGENKLKYFSDWDQVLFFIRKDNNFFIYFSHNYISMIKAGSQADSIELFFKNNSILKKG